MFNFCLTSDNRSLGESIVNKRFGLNAKERQDMLVSGMPEYFVIQIANSRL
jgi:hypothetical protein